MDYALKHHPTAQLTPQQNNIIPVGKFIAEDERYLIKPLPKPMDDSFPQAGKELVEYGYSFGRQPPDFTYKSGGKPLAMNYNFYIYNQITGFY
jgi:hypothetical protein